MKLDSIKIKLNNLHYILLFLIIFICLFFRAYESLSFFRFTHYLFNYEYEFLKRGLIGEILRLSFENINYKLVQLISLIFIIVLSIIIFKIFVKNFNKKSNISRLIFSVMIFTSPLTIQHFIYDIGRFDIINLIITFLCFFIIEKFYKNSLLIFFTTGILISLMLLIHEGALIMFVPMIFGYWFFKNSEKHTIITQIILFIIILFLAFKISLTGLATRFTLDEYYTLFSKQNADVSKWSIQVLYRGLFNVLDDGVINPLFKDAAVIGLTKTWIFHNFVLMFFLLPVFYVTFVIFKNFLSKSKFQTKVLLISSLSPFALFFLGPDHMRWWSLIFTNIFIIFFILSKETDSYSEIIIKSVIKYKSLCIISIIEGFILGPVRVYESFDIIVNIFGFSAFPY
tara:strand:+ start:22 stop:1215 length:1194 start_codon:yes stop_codon:yes gene_type:complete